MLRRRAPAARRAARAPARRRVRRGGRTRWSASRADGAQAGPARSRIAWRCARRGRCRRRSPPRCSARWTRSPSLRTAPARRQLRPAGDPGQERPRPHPQAESGLSTGWAPRDAPSRPEMPRAPRAPNWHFPAGALGPAAGAAHSDDRADPRQPGRRADPRRRRHPDAGRRRPARSRRDVRARPPRRGRSEVVGRCGAPGVRPGPEEWTVGVSASPPALRAAA